MISDKKYVNAADVSKEFYGDRASREAEEERRHQNHTTRPGKQRQNQEDESPVKPGTELH